MTSTRSRLSDAHLESIHGYLVRLRTSVNYFRQNPREYTAWIDGMLDQVKVVDERLTGAREDFQNLLWSLGDGLLVLDGEGRVANANPLATRLIGAPLDALRGAPMHTLASDEMRLFEGLPGALRRGYRRNLRGVATMTSEAFACSVTALDSRPDDTPRGYVIVMRPDDPAVQSQHAPAHAEEIAAGLERELSMLHRTLAATEQEVEQLRAALTASEASPTPPPLPDAAFEEAWSQLEATRAALGAELEGVRQALADAQAERAGVEGRLAAANGELARLETALAAAEAGKSQAWAAAEAARASLDARIAG
ncbi:MAG: PAS domain-containing protein, partial [Myxococcales bacterium]|nr:PAS domain-containing protein [Myxococcales bacterium]